MLASKQSPSRTGAMFSGVPVIRRSPSPRVIPATFSRYSICCPILKIMLPVLSCWRISPFILSRRSTLWGSEMVSLGTKSPKMRKLSYCFEIVQLCPFEIADLIIEKSPISKRRTYAPILSSQVPSLALTPFKITPSSTSWTVAPSAACHGIRKSVPFAFNLHFKLNRGNLRSKRLRKYPRVSGEGNLARISF